MQLEIFWENGHCRWNVSVITWTNQNIIDLWKFLFRDDNQIFHVNYSMWSIEGVKMHNVNTLQKYKEMLSALEDIFNTMEEDMHVNSLYISDNYSIFQIKHRRPFLHGHLENIQARHLSCNNSYKFFPRADILIGFNQYRCSDVCSNILNLVNTGIGICACSANFKMRKTCRVPWWKSNTIPLRIMW